LTLLLGLSLPVFAALSARAAADPIHLSLTFIQSNPVTTIGVGGQTVQAIVDTGGDGAITLSKEVIDSVGGRSVGDVLVTTNALGHELEKRRFRVPAVTIDGHTLDNIAVVQAPETGGPPIPNGIRRQFLSRYFVVVDYAGGSITLWPPDANKAACGHTRIPMEHTEEQQLAVSEFGTQSGRLRLLWDTGATYSALPETIADKLRPAPTVRGNTRFWQADVLSAAGSDFGPVEFVLLPLKLPGDFQGVLGRNFLEHHLVCLDYKLREIRVR
jgi:predicted aspartyl protease